MPRKRQRKPRQSWPFLLLIALIIVGLFALYLYNERQQQGQSGGVGGAGDITEDRLVFAGVPRAAPGAGDEVRVTVLRNRGFITGYSESRRDPLWVTYRAFRMEQPYDFSRPSGFTPDPRTAARVRETDFARSGFDRGHMAPNATIMRNYGREAQLETFLLSNVCPQTPELNQRVWERLESAERRFADSCEEVWVIVGPIFGDLNGGTTPRLASGIAVPSAFYRILIDEQVRPGGVPRIFSVIMPQQVKGTELPQEFLSTVDDIERQTHLDFLWKMEDGAEEELEGARWKMWDQAR